MKKEKFNKLLGTVWVSRKNATVGKVDFFSLLLIQDIQKFTCTVNMTTTPLLMALEDIASQYRQTGMEFEITEDFAYFEFLNKYREEVRQDLLKLGAIPMVI